MEFISPGRTAASEACFFCALFNNQVEGEGSVVLMWNRLFPAGLAAGPF